MKIGIACNHSYPHCGGSERVIHQIGSSLVAEYGCEVSVISRSRTSKSDHEGVHYMPCASSPGDFIKQIDRLKLDYLFVYSDCFAHWPTILRNIDSIKCRIGVALVGMNHMLGHRGDKLLFRDYIDRIDAVTHSDNYQDYRECNQLGIPVTVIPNGVDLREFDNNDLPSPVEGPYILCVSNFFPGKGQQYLVEALNRLAERRSDFSAVFLSTTVNFPLAKMLAEGVRKSLDRARFRSFFLVDQSREQTVNYFKHASVFAFPSQKEVAPLVLLEAMASGVPWVAMRVGNAPTLAGGFLAPNRSADRFGYLVWCQETYDAFVDQFDALLSDSKLRDAKGREGREQVEALYNWDVIASRYYELFSHGRAAS